MKISNLMRLVMASTSESIETFMKTKQTLRGNVTIARSSPPGMRNYFVREKYIRRYSTFFEELAMMRHSLSLHRLHTAEMVFCCHSSTKPVRVNVLNKT